MTDLPDTLVPLLAAFFFAFPIAWHRERGSRRMGLRTLPLVAIASCGFALVGRDLAASDPGALTRVLQGLITGIGFIGGGAIVKSGADVHGTATAAAIWATGAVGAASAFGRYDLAFMISAATFLTLLVLTRLRDRLRDEGDLGGGGSGDVASDAADPRSVAETKGQAAS